MKRKSSRCCKNHRQIGVRDLFGEVPVTWDEIYEWCEIVAGITRDSPRLEVYIKGWDVVGKIRAAKLSGYYEAFLKKGAYAEI